MNRVSDVANFTEHTLYSWGMKFFLMHNDNCIPRLSMAFEEAERTKRPVAVLVGDEYHGFNR